MARGGANDHTFLQRSELAPELVVLLEELGFIDKEALADHEADTTSVHGIVDTADLVTSADIAGFITEEDLNAHIADSTNVHGIVDTTQLALKSEVAAEEKAREEADKGKADLDPETGDLDESQLPSSVVTDSAESAKNIDSTGVATLDLLGYDGTKYAPAGQAQIAAFANPFDAVLFVAGENREDPELQSQGIYVQHRVKGDLGAVPHGAIISELRVNAGSNAGSGSAASENSLVISGGANTVSKLYGVLANFKTENTPTGTVEDLRLINVQEATDSGEELTVNTCYGLYITAQNVGTTNYSLYVAGGVSVIGGVVSPSGKTASGLVIRGVSSQEEHLFQVQTSAPLSWFYVSKNGSTVTGRELGKSATDGFLYIPTVAGAPEGTPTTQSGRVALVYDKTNNKLYLYNGAWKSVALT